MPTIVMASSKGGAGKTTASVLLAGEFARQGAEKGIGVTLIDGDPNQHSAKWAKKPGCPENITLIENATEENIVDEIESAEEKTPFVIVDLEGTASMAVANAISRADMVIIMCQASQDDIDEAVKTIKLIKRQEKVLRRDIPYSVLFTRTSAAIVTNTFKYITGEFEKNGVEMFKTQIMEREAFKAIRSYGGIVNNLEAGSKQANAKAAENVKSLVLEVKRRLLASASDEAEVSNG